MQLNPKTQEFIDKFFNRIPIRYIEESRYTLAEQQRFCEKCENGYVECQNCGHTGRIECCVCYGEGCDDCEDTGYYTCADCGGGGDTECRFCGGTGKIIRDIKYVYEIRPKSINNWVKNNAKQLEDVGFFILKDLPELNLCLTFDTHTPNLEKAWSDFQQILLNEVENIT